MNTTLHHNWSPRIAKLAEEYGDTNPTTGENTLPAYAWPGGYPILYCDGDGETICPACANLTSDDGMPIVAYYVHYEGPPEYCANCNAEIESAYGDPDDNDDDDTP